MLRPCQLRFFVMLKGAWFGAFGAAARNRGRPKDADTCKWRLWYYMRHISITIVLQAKLGTLI